MNGNEQRTIHTRYNEMNARIEVLETVIASLTECQINDRKAILEALATQRDQTLAMADAQRTYVDEGDALASDGLVAIGKTQAATVDHYLGFVRMNFRSRLHWLLFGATEGSEHA